MLRTQMQLVYHQAMFVQIPLGFEALLAEINLNMFMTQFRNQEAYLRHHNIEFLQVSIVTWDS